MNRITDYKQLATDITNWIRDYAISNNIKSLVVGVSGGIDSAVVSTLCARTELFTFCAVLPIRSNPDHIHLAREHVFKLMKDHGPTNKELCDLTMVFEEFCVSTSGFFRTSLALSNTKSRLRMTYLYQIAATQRGIVVGTGNKVEDFGCGFFTKGGDGMADISPIADLYKTEVRELGKYLGVSQEILDAQPTDGLWEDGRTDEEQIGATYEELEWAMEKGKTFASQHTDRQKEVVDIYDRLHKQNQHKMLPIPIYKLNL